MIPIFFPQWWYMVDEVARQDLGVEGFRLRKTNPRFYVGHLEDCVCHGSNISHGIAGD